MLSICIPVYNFNITNLVTELYEQIKILETNVEIILIDDCSDERFQEQNKELENLYNVSYKILQKNIGRSKIRNLFLKYAKYKYLLFLDCDLKIENNNFLKNYINSVKKSFETVVCGGLAYENKKVNKSLLLRWNYGHKYESICLEKRKENPYQSFMTSNFLVPKSIFQNIKFDEKITKYGHEDTLFGLSLKNQNVKIEHIKNPVIHIGLETNEIFLNKTEQSIINLIYILNELNFDENFINSIKILKFHQKMKKKNLISFIKLLFFFSEKFIKFLLINGIINLKLFNFYKLGVLIKYYNKKMIN